MIFPLKTGPLARAQFAQRFELSKHEGTDVFAPAGTEVLAVDDGVVRQAREPKGGLVVYLKARDGSQYYYAHLDAFSSPLSSPDERIEVQTGDSLGYVGTTGNARGAPPHLHFEVRNAAGEKVDPYPLLLRAANNEQLMPPAASRPAARAETPKVKKRVKSAPLLGSGVGVLLLLWLFGRGGGGRWL